MQEEQKRYVEVCAIKQMREALRWVLRNYISSGSGLGFHEFGLNVVPIHGGIRIYHEIVSFDVINRASEVYWEYQNPTYYRSTAQSHGSMNGVSQLVESQQVTDILKHLYKNGGDPVSTLLERLVSTSLYKAEDFFRVMENTELQKLYFGLLKKRVPHMCALLGTVVEVMWLSRKYTFKYADDREFNLFRLGLKIPDHDLLNLRPRMEKQSLAVYLAETRWEHKGKKFMHPADLALRDKHLRKAAFNINTLQAIQKQLLNWSTFNTEALHTTASYMASVLGTLHET